MSTESASLRAQGWMLIAAWVAAVLFCQFVLGEMKESGSIAGALLVRGFQIGASFILPSEAAKSFRRARTLMTPSAEELLRSDPRPPIVFLRSFKDDGSAKDLSGMQLLQPLFTPIGASYTQTPSFEQEITFGLDSMGPVVAIAEPEVEFADIGASRIRTEDWERDVVKYLQRARIVVVRAGETKGLLWELEQIVRLVDPEKVFIYLQFGAEQDDGVQQARYNRFRRSVAHIFPVALPDRFEKKRVLHFDADWNPRLSKKVLHALKEKSIRFEQPVRNELKKNLPFAHAATQHLERRLASRRVRDVGTSGWILKLVTLILTVATTCWPLGLLYGAILFVNPVPLAGLMPFLAFFYAAGALSGLAGTFLSFPARKSYWFVGCAAGFCLVWAKWVAYLSFIDGLGFYSPSEIDARMSELLFLLDANDPDAGAASDVLWTFEMLLGPYISGTVAWVFGFTPFARERLASRPPANADT